MLVSEKENVRFEVVVVFPFEEAVFFDVVSVLEKWYFCLSEDQEDDFLVTWDSLEDAL